jgi:hypothetical protein
MDAKFTCCRGEERELKLIKIEKQISPIPSRYKV